MQCLIFFLMHEEFFVKITLLITQNLFDKSPFTHIQIKINPNNSKLTSFFSKKI